MPQVTMSGAETTGSYGKASGRKAPAGSAVIASASAGKGGVQSVDGGNSQASRKVKRESWMPAAARMDSAAGFL